LRALSLRRDERGGSRAGSPFARAAARRVFNPF
jgi:hypothetical protein